MISMNNRYSEQVSKDDKRISDMIIESGNENSPVHTSALFPDLNSNSLLEIPMDRESSKTAEKAIDDSPISPYFA